MSDKSATLTSNPKCDHEHHAAEFVDHWQRWAAQPWPCPWCEFERLSAELSTIGMKYAIGGFQRDRLRAALTDAITDIEERVSEVPGDGLAARLAYYRTLTRQPIETSAAHAHQWESIGDRCGPMVNYICACGWAAYIPMTTTNTT